MSADSSSTPAESKRSRNPVERFLVWGLIALGLILVGNEAMARFGYTSSLKNLQTALEADDSGDVLTLEEVEDHISGFPDRQQNETERVVVYEWSGLLKDYGSIRLPYSHENEVLGLLTAEPPPVPVLEPREGGDEEEESYAEEDEEPEESAEAAGGGRGGRNFDPMQFDRDGDGKISRDEAPERMQERFADIDTNNDGFADAEEFEAIRANFQRGLGGENNRPQRPRRPTEEDVEAATGDDATEDGTPDGADAAAEEEEADSPE